MRDPNHDVIQIVCSDLMADKIAELVGEVFDLMPLPRELQQDDDIPMYIFTPTDDAVRLMEAIEGEST
jgi:hypothetical protein